MYPNEDAHVFLRFLIMTSGFLSGSEISFNFHNEYFKNMFEQRLKDTVVSIHESTADLNPVYAVDRNCRKISKTGTV